MSSRSPWPFLQYIGNRNSNVTPDISTRPRAQQTIFTHFGDSHAQQHQQRHQNTQQSPHLPQYSSGNSVGPTVNTFIENYQQPRHGYLGLTPNQASREPIMSDDAPFENNRATVDSPVLWANWRDFENQLTFSGNEELPSMSQPDFRNNSYPNKNLEETSLYSITNDNSWITIDRYPKLNAFQHSTAIFNPSQTLHLRTPSDSSSSDCTGQIIDSFDNHSYEDTSYSYSPDSEGYLNRTKDYHGSDEDVSLPHCHSHPHIDNLRPSTPFGPDIVKKPSSSKPKSPISISPPARRNSAPRKTSLNKATKSPVRRSSSIKKDSEKRVGRRRGPLLPEQRKQASEIRKLRACLRCKFLKKTCDKGEPCTGCQPSHARLWQVPCTRIDIKDIAYFMKDWKADYERLIGSGISVYNIKGFAQNEKLIWITHGYGFAIPIMTREVYLMDENCLTVSWVESVQNVSYGFNAHTSRFSAGSKGISTEMLSEYLDKHVEGTYEAFIDNFFEGTPFITEILSTVHHYYVKEKTPAIRKALKLLLAYNLTLHITFVEQHGEEHQIDGLVKAEKSRFYNKIIAPVMINFQIKCALADIWRGLKSEVLAELSALYSSVYSGERLKNWPTIFMLVSVLLILWEEMQFDSHYRMSDQIAAQKFCNDMEAIPVGVIIGLFHAISQKLPSFTEWDTLHHGQLLNNNRAVCEVMSEMRSHVTKHENYLRTRPDTQFNPHDFDCLSNKLLSKLVIRTN
ncbi:putative c6 finger domain-containing protein [Erysiphe neolycopersici]|uniref:Putative c6 finger domain-containing protein n=1 Tax=Erysiphe neolycopersici TaxID=212602 RepID=A0A420HST3_9PEZI|nr:putative c6 finger domain-containing protein [Erysiphe neolycopersici]